MSVPCRDIDRLNRQFREILDMVLIEANQWGGQQKPPVEFIITETFRTVERQRELYKQNAPGKWVTNCDGVRRKSPHQSGNAADFAPVIGGRAMWQRHDLFLKFGEIAESYGLTWGGRWKKYDGPHVQLGD